MAKNHGSKTQVRIEAERGLGGRVGEGGRKWCGGVGSRPESEEKGVGLACEGKVILRS